ncbi:MAG: anti-sigma factor domain-containing protein [Acidimicrobiales bacterium]
MSEFEPDSDFDPDYVELEADFGDVMEILGEGPVEPPTEAPSEDVWTAIAMEVGGDIAAEAIAADAAAKERAAAAAQEGARVVSLDERRSRGKRFAIATAVAAAALLVGVPLALAIGGDSPERTAELEALGGFDGEGQAELSGRTLEVDLTGLDAPEGSFYELWLLNLEGEELEDLRSLGPVAADGTFTVPEDVDLDQFSVVDVSIELDDGNPDHSGQSVLRGGLET